MKKEIDVLDYAGHICKEMKKGILLTSKAGDTLNTMTIGWGMLGIEWGKPIFIAFVRESRFTRHLIEESGEFTVNIPYGDIDNKVLGFCGTKSGRDVDKFTELGLNTEEPLVIKTPGIRQLPLTLECKVLYTQPQELSAIPQAILDRYYPQNVDGSDPGKNRDRHIAYYAEIVGAYLIEN